MEYDDMYRLERCEDNLSHPTARGARCDNINLRGYNKMVKAAYDKLSEEEVQKRKENYWKEKEEYKREMTRLGKTIPPIKQYKNPKYTIRCSPNQMVWLASNIDETKKQQIRDMGFGGLLEIQCRSIPNGIGTWLVDNFNPTLSSFQLHGDGVLPLTAKDIGFILGIPNDGPLPVEDADSSEGGDSGPSRRTYKWKELPEELVSMSSGDEFKRLFVAFACGCLLAPTTRAEHKIRLWGCTKVVTEVASLNWAQYIRNVLCNRILEVQKKSGKQHQYVGGCIFVLLVHYLDRVTILKHRVARVTPRAKAWTDALISQRDALEIDNLGGYGKGKLIGAHEEEEAESGAQINELPPELVGIMMDSGHHDIAAELSEVYSMTVNCQRRILKIAEILCSHPRAKAAATEVVSKEKQKQRLPDSEHIHLDMESEDYSEYQSAEDGKDSKDLDDGDSEKEQDAGGTADDIVTSIRSIDETEPTNRQAIGQKTVEKEQSGRTSDGKEAKNDGITGDGKDISFSGNKANDTPPIGQPDSRDVEVHTDHITSISDRITDEATQHMQHDCSTGPIQIEHPLDGPNTPRRLRSYSRKRKAAVEDENEGRPTRATKKSSMLRSAEYLLPSHVTVSTYDKRIAAFAWEVDQNPKETLIQMFQLSLTRDDLRTLCDGMHVSTRVIDMFARHINWGGATSTTSRVKRYIVEPIAVDGILNLRKFDAQSDDILTAKLIKLFKIRGPDNSANPSKCQLILVPVCVDSYWFVYSFHVTHHVVHLLDPDPQQAKSKDITVLKRLQRGLGLIMAAKFGMKIDFASFKLEVADVPHQSPDSWFDSGVFTMTFLEHWSGRLAMRITKENITKYRMLYTARLCSSEHNTKFVDTISAMLGSK
ncbi:uncharacterized protein [Coffea arabica]|uniref:Ubiquitin-like protease family profile domain-containing protein n=1 Tax=Coffea arabica TaxID=13443 RepID=A0ABM4WQ71_COFAR